MQNLEARNFFQRSYNVSSFLSFRLGCSDDSDPNSILSHVVQDPDVTDGVRDEGVDADDEVEEEELKNINQGNSVKGPHQTRHFHTQYVNITIIRHFDKKDIFSSHCCCISKSLQDRGTEIFPEEYFQFIHPKKYWMKISFYPIIFSSKYLLITILFVKMSCLMKAFQKYF